MTDERRFEGGGNGDFRGLVASSVGLRARSILVIRDGKVEVPLVDCTPVVGLLDNVVESLFVCLDCPLLEDVVSTYLDGQIHETEERKGWVDKHTHDDIERRR